MKQSQLDNFFKVKISNISIVSSKKVVRKNRLQLKTKISKKTPKLMLDAHSVSAVVNLISDDENQEEEINCSAISTKSSSSGISDSTIVYSVEKKTSPGPSQFSTPSPKKKFFSPNKKRSLPIKSPIKAKRNLNLSLGSEEVKDEEFTEITKGLDDNTIFLMKIVYECLNDRNLQSLLSETSLNLLEKSIHAAPPGKRMVCRLYWQVCIECWQKEQWCRWKKIRDNACGKSDIDDPTVQMALNYLIESGFISVAQFNGQKHDLDFDELVKIMHEPELKEICKGLKMKAKNKDVAIKLLRDFKCKKTNITNYLQGGTTNNESRLLKIMGTKAEICYKLADQARTALNELYILMYLGMNYSVIREGTLELMLLNEKAKRETFPVDRDLLDNASVVFSSRLEFERYLNAHFIYEEFLVKTESEKCRLIESVFNIFKAIPNEEMMSYTTLPVWLRRFTPAYLYVKILEQGITDLKRDRSYVNLILDILTALIAQNIFRQHKKAYWIDEKALVLDRLLGDSDQAAEVLLQGFKMELPSESEQLLYPRALKLAKRKTNKIDDKSARLLAEHADQCASWEREMKAEHIYRVPVDNFSKGKIKFPVYKDGVRTLLSAEDTCIHYFVEETRSYTHGGHWEGKIVTTIFFLLFWDIIYARLRGLRGLFLSRYQAFPLDLCTDCFYDNRRLLLERRLRDIEEGSDADMLARMQDTWLSRPESEVSSGIQRQVGWDNISAVCGCLGARRVAALCRRLATDYQYAHSGFPDLTLWNVHTKQVTFVEVKTDSDKPSMKQKQWMRYLQRHGVDVSFCYIGVHTMRARARNRDDVDYSDHDDS